MQNRTDIELAKLLVRSKICPKCYQRPQGTEELGPSFNRTCESRCTLFTSLSKLLLTMERSPVDATPDYVLRQVVCPSCKTNASAADFCADALSRTCPLDRYGGEVLALFEDMRRVAAAVLENQNRQRAD